MHWPHSAHRHGLGVAWGVALLTMSVAASVACSPPPRWWDSCALPRGSSVAPGVKTTDHLVVYLDVSKNMRGLVGGQGRTQTPPAQTVFSKTLLALRSAVSTLRPRPEVVLRVLGAEVSAPVDDSQLLRYAVNRSWFRGSRPRLAAAFDAFQEPLERRGPGVESGPARFHVLLTDGMPSGHGGRREQNISPGSDTHFVREKISQLLSSGWGGTVLGVRAQFDGLVFSEVRPNWSVRYASEPDNPETFRPFYLYVFSPDRGALGKLVEAIKNELRPLLQSPGQLREYALAAPYVTAAASGDLVSTNEETYTPRREDGAPEETLCFDVSIAPTAERPTPRARQGDALSERDGLTPTGEQTQTVAPLTFNLRIPWSHHACDSGTPQQVAGLVKWELTPTPSTPERGARYPEIRIVGSTVNADGSVSLQMAARWGEGAGKRQARIYRLVGRLDLEQTAPPWVTAWSASTDTTAKDASRTLNLKVSLAHLWNNQFLQRQEVAVACLRVGG